MEGTGVGPPAGYVELQLRLARRAASLGTHALGDAVDQLTNLRRRLGHAGPAAVVESPTEVFDLADEAAAPTAARPARG